MSRSCTLPSPIEPPKPVLICLLPSWESQPWIQLEPSGQTHWSPACSSQVTGTSHHAAIHGRDPLLKKTSIRYLMTLEVFSNLNDSMIPYFYEMFTIKKRCLKLRFVLRPLINKLTRSTLRTLPYRCQAEAMMLMKRWVNTSTIQTQQPARCFLCWAARGCCCTAQHYIATPTLSQPLRWRNCSLLHMNCNPNPAE